MTEKFVNKAFRWLLLCVFHTPGAMGILLTSLGAWTIFGYDSCRQTFVCDNDVIPPAITAGTGLGVAVFGTTYALVGHRAMTGKYNDIRSPLLAASACLLTVGFGLIAFDTHQMLTDASSGLSYYQWVEKQGTTTYVVNLLADVMMAGVGVFLLRRHRQLGYPYI